MARLTAKQRADHDAAVVRAKAALEDGDAVEAHDVSRTCIADILSAGAPYPDNWREFREAVDLAERAFLRLTTTPNPRTST